MGFCFGARELSVVVFSILSTYILSFVFEGQVLYDLFALSSYDCGYVPFAIILCHFVGLLCGFFIRNAAAAKRVITGGCALALLFTAPFLFAPQWIWSVLLAFSALATGAAVAAWGWFLKSCTPRSERIKSCADVLILSNVLMIATNVTSVFVSMRAALALLLLALAAALTLSLRLPTETVPKEEPCPETNLPRCMAYLCLFVVTITINSGLMYRVLNPAFAHLSSITVWYWAMPYIAALAVMRRLPLDKNRSGFLYIAMLMVVSSFVAFMFTGRGVSAYLLVNTLMLGACGIFDLFWWSTAGAMLDYSRNPAVTFGCCLAANVMGVLLGSVAGSAMSHFNVPEANIAVLALVIVCVTMAMLPLLNSRLVILLACQQPPADVPACAEQPSSDADTKSAVILTARETSILNSLLAGKTNKVIAEEFRLSENTIKTHVKNIYAKHNVSSRMELILKLHGKSPQ